MEFEIDAITQEVLRHRFMMIADEMGDTLVQISSSPVVTEVKDFCTALFTADGQIAAMGAYVIGHVGAMRFVIDAVTRMHRVEDMSNGDMFLLNDPYLGALHQSDIVVVAPIFVGDQLIGWAGCMAHHMDVGSVQPGGSSPEATEVYQEGLRIPGLRFVTRGQVHDDLLEMLRGMVRTPELLELDLRGQIAANNTGVERMKSLCDQYGCDVVVQAMSRFIQSTEERLRARLSKIPDGRVQYRDYLDNIGSSEDTAVIKVCLTKEGDRLVIDFTGTSPQVPGFVNCTFPGTWGGIFTAILPTLAYDILPWNQGVGNCVEVIAPEGSLIHPKPPAPVGSASTRGAWLVANAVHYCLARLLALDPEFQAESMAGWYGSNQQIILTGHDRSGARFAMRLMDTIGGGGGARHEQDGIDCGGNRNSPSLSMMNVEVLENTCPLLFLFRRPARDSGGAGKQRGGCGLEEAFVPWGTDAIRITTNGLGLEFSNSTGMEGGLPGAPGRFLLARRSETMRLFRKGLLPRSMEETGGVLHVPPANMSNELLAEGDVFYCRHLGGGGWGDPLDRAPESVRRDVINGLVSAEAAKQLYGVVFRENGQFSHETTRKERLKIRQKRLSGNGYAPGATPLKRHNPKVERGAVCSSCGHGLGLWGPTLKERLLVRELPPGEVSTLGPAISRFVIRLFLCPHCGTIFTTEIALKGEPILVEYEPVVHSRRVAAPGGE